MFWKNMNLSETPQTLLATRLILYTLFQKQNKVIFGVSHDFLQHFLAIGFI